MLETLALFSQVAAAAAVFASLIFVGLQIREQANATRAQTEQAVAANWLVVADVMGSNAHAVIAGLQSESETLAGLDEAERLQFFSIMFGFFKHYENIYLQYRRGRITTEEWEPCSNHVLMFLGQPGVRTWWTLRKSAFAPQFRDFLERSLAPDKVTMVAIHDVSRGAGQRGRGRCVRHTILRRRRMGKWRPVLLAALCIPSLAAVADQQTAMTD